jgi:hypothetical protein
MIMSTEPLMDTIASAGAYLTTVRLRGGLQLWADRQIREHYTPSVIDMMPLPMT